MAPTKDVLWEQRIQDERNQLDSIKNQIQIANAELQHYKQTVQRSKEELNEKQNALKTYMERVQILSSKKTNLEFELLKADLSIENENSEIEEYLQKMINESSLLNNINNEISTNNCPKTGDDDKMYEEKIEICKQLQDAEITFTTLQKKNTATQLRLIKTLENLQSTKASLIQMVNEFSD